MFLKVLLEVPKATVVSLIYWYSSRTEPWQLLSIIRKRPINSSRIDLNLPEKVILDPMRA